MSFGKSSGKSNQAVNQTQNASQNQSQSQDQYQGQVQNQSQGQTETPNNLPLLQQAWSILSGLTGGTSGNAVTNANDGLSLVANGAHATSDAARAALGQATNIATASPTANPFFDNLVKQISNTVQQQTDGDFGASGRYGSGANANAFNTAVTNQAGQLGYQNYTDTLNRQLQAMGIIPQLGAAAQSAGTGLYGAGIAPITTMAQLLQTLGQGGGTANATASGTGEGYGTANGSASGTSSGTMNGTSSGSSSQTSFGLDLGKLIQPFKLFG